MRLPAPFRLFLMRGQSFKSLIGRRKSGEMSSSVELGSGFGRFLAAKIEFSYRAGQTVNLLALRLQWFESTPTQASPRAILQVFKPLSGDWVSNLQKESARSWQTLKFPAYRIGIRFFVLALNECVAESARANFNGSRTGLALREGVQRAKGRHLSGCSPAG